MHAEQNIFSDVLNLPVSNELHDFDNERKF